MVKSSDSCTHLFICQIAPVIMTFSTLFLASYRRSNMLGSPQLFLWKEEMEICNLQYWFQNLTPRHVMLTQVKIPVLLTYLKHGSSFKPSRSLKLSDSSWFKALKSPSWFSYFTFLDPKSPQTLTLASFSSIHTFPEYLSLASLPAPDSIDRKMNESKY